MLIPLEVFLDKNKPDSPVLQAFVDAGSIIALIEHGEPNTTLMRVSQSHINGDEGVSRVNENIHDVADKINKALSK